MKRKTGKRDVGKDVEKMVDDFIEDVLVPYAGNNPDVDPVAVASAFVSASARATTIMYEQLVLQLKDGIDDLKGRLAMSGLVH